MGKNLGTSKDIADLARKAKKQGWTVEVTNSNHLRFTPPKREPQGDQAEPPRRGEKAKNDTAPPFVTSPLTPGDHRAIRAVRNKLIKAGLKLGR